MNQSSRPDRRSLLRGAAALAGSAALLPAPLRAARQRAVEGLSGLRGDRGDYSLDGGLLYLNHGSIGTIPRVVQQAQIGYLQACESNPWLHMWGGAWEGALADTRARTARFLRVGADDLAITRNTTEGFNVLARGLPLGGGDEVLFTSLNHAGASLCFEHAAAERGYRVRRVEFPLAEVPSLSEDDVVALHVAALGDDTRVVVLPHVDNMVGVRHPVAKIAAAVRAKGVRHVFVDGAQVVGAVPVDVAGLGVDAYATSPHKWLQAPKGIGLLWTTPALREQLQPLIVTWGQQRFAGSARVLEDYGTRALPNVLGLGDAVAFQEELGIAASAARREAVHGAFRAAAAAEPGVAWLSPTDFARGASLFALRVAHADHAALATRLFEAHQIVTRGFGEEDGWLRISPNAVHDDEAVTRFFTSLRKARAS